MKFKKILLILLMALVIMITSNITVNADMGPKPSIFIDIVGIEGEYVAAFAAKKANGPNYDYEHWLKDGKTNPEYHPIMEYKDQEGFKWITRYYKCDGNSEIRFTYYAPSEFKIIIYKDNELYKVTEAKKMYAFRTYFKIDFSKEDIKIKNTYPYYKEVLEFILRLAITLAVEIGLYFLFRLHTKRNFKIVMIVNIATQLLLNIIINLSTFYQGELYALIILILCELVIFIVEPIIYMIFMRKKNKLLIALYGILANILTFVIGFISLLII